MAGNKKNVKKAQGLFAEKKEIPRSDLRRFFRKASPYIPGTGGKMYSRRERERMEKEIFPPSKFGSHITEREARKQLKEMRDQAFRSKKQSEKREIKRKIRYLKERTGIN